ncbi:hypothetical protein DL93DRAFT_2090973, partial [Clavulina sp. PMI_390]
MREPSKERQKKIDEDDDGGGGNNGGGRGNGGSGRGGRSVGNGRGGGFGVMIGQWEGNVGAAAAGVEAIQIWFRAMLEPNQSHLPPIAARYAGLILRIFWAS